MIRLTIVLVHTFAAAIVASAASLGLLQAIANLTWEWSFYAELTQATLMMAAAGLGLLATAAADVGLCVAWFIGEVRGAWILVLTSLILSLTFPLWIGLSLQATVALVLMDVMVQRHKERSKP